MTIKFIVKLLSSSILIISGILKSIDLEPFEFSLVEKGLFNWELSPLMIRIIVILEIFTGISILLKSFSNRIQNILLLLLCFFYTVDIFSIPKNGLYIYELMYLHSEWLTVIGIIVLVLFLILNFNTSDKIIFKKRKFRLILNASTFLSIATYLLIMNPLFIDDFVNNDTSVAESKLNWDVLYDKAEETGIEINKEKPVFYAFYSTSCFYCNRSSKMIGITNRVQSPNIPVIMVFPGNEEDTKNFIERNKCNLPYIRVSQDDFIRLGGYTYPSFHKIQNNKEINRWDGRTFNYKEIDKLFE